MFEPILRVVERWFTSGRVTTWQLLIQSSTMWLFLLLAGLAGVFGWKGYDGAWLGGVAAAFLVLFILRDVVQFREMDSLQRMNQKLTDINEITEAMRSTVNLEHVLKVILVSLTRGFGYDRAFIFLREGDPDTNVDVLKGTIGIGVPQELLTVFQVPAANPLEIVGKTAADRTTLIVRDAKKDPRVDKEFATMLDLDEFATVPLEAKGYVVGVLVVDRLKKGPGHSITEEDVALLAVFANQAAIAIENAKLYAKIERMSVTDGLTELFNHRNFQEQLNKEWSRSERLKEPLGLIMIDIDNFKHFNDTNGHQMGDKLLKMVSSLIKTTVRKVDIPARYGGEEFAVILPGTDLQGTQALAEKLRQRIEGYPFPNRETQPLGKVSASIGVSALPGKATTPAELVSLADQGLYQAKRTGKNRVCIVELSGKPS